MGSAVLDNLMTVYILLAIGYNLASFFWLEIRGRSFAPTVPSDAIHVMTVFYCAYLLSKTMPLAVAVLILVSYFFSIGRFGILRHLTSYSAKEYLSRLTWVTAISINVFGVLVIAATIFNLLC